MSFLRTLQTASRYRLDDKIATGGYGEVWRATDVLLGRTVAVKQLPPNRARSEQTLIRFRAEAQRAGSLGHENITRVYDYVEPAPPDPPFLVMELVDGPSAAQVLACGALHPAQAMSVVAEAAAGLQAAHEAGLVHRDIKPANLLLTRGGQVKVTDFGVSYAINSQPMTSSNTLLGTAGYVAPERLTGGGVTAAADLYALGIVAWECLTGRPPFRGTPIEVVVAHRDQPLPPLPASVPGGVVALVEELTAKDPAARPASAGEVARRAAELRDRLARAAGVSACPLAGPWSRAGAGTPSGPVGVSTVPSSEVALVNRAFERTPEPPGPTEPPSAGAQPPPPAAAPPEPAPPGAVPSGVAPPGAGQVPAQPVHPAVRPEQARARRRAGRLKLAVGTAAVALAAAGVIVAQLTGAGPARSPSPGAASHRAPGPSTTRQAAGPASGHHPGTSRPSSPTVRVAGGPVISHVPSAGNRPVGTTSSAPAVTGGGPASTPSAKPGPSTSPVAGAGNGQGKAKGEGKGNGQGSGPGNGNGHGPGNG
jgi:eukaryotic-like serine/threonine-protein kinase